MFIQTNRATFASIIGLALVMLATSSGAEAASELPNTGITLKKAAHQAGKLVISGTTRRAGQIVKLDHPARSRTSRADKVFRIVAPLLPGDCEIKLTVRGKSDLVKVSACGPTGPQGVGGSMGQAGPMGPMGPSGPAGTGFTPRGPHMPGTEYAINDVVSFNGSSYAAAVDSPSEAPGVVGDEWRLLAEKGDAGQTGPAGPAGPTGPTGASGISQAIPLFGSGGTVPGGSGVYVFVGPTSMVTLTAGQKIIASISAPISVNPTESRTFLYGICHQLGGVGAITNPAGSNSLIGHVPPGQSIVLANSSIISGLASGSYRVGTCLVNSSSSSVTMSSVNGWILVTN